MPGGIANKSFVAEWDAFCKAMDSNDFLKLPSHSALALKLLSKCVPCPLFSAWLHLSLHCHAAGLSGTLIDLPVSVNHMSAPISSSWQKIVKPRLTCF